MNPSAHSSAFYTSIPGAERVELGPVIERMTAGTVKVGVQ